MRKFFIILLFFLNMSFCFAEDKTSKVYIDTALKFIIDIEGEKIYFTGNFNIRDDDGFNLEKGVIKNDNRK